MQWLPHETLTDKESSSYGNKILQILRQIKSFVSPSLWSLNKALKVLQSVINIQNKKNSKESVFDCQCCLF